MGILCMPNVPLSIGTSEKVWKKENSLKPVKIWLLLRRITKKLVLTLLKLKVKRAKNTKRKKKCFPFKKKNTCRLDRRKFPYNWLDNSVQDNPYLSVHFQKKTFSKKKKKKKKKKK